MKTCTMCGLSKALSEFNTYKSNGSEKRRSRCRNCLNNVQKERYRKNPDFHRDYLLRTKYGLSLDDYDSMVEKQGGRCAVCGTNNPNSHHKRFVVDHNHTTGQVRGLLCSTCNTGLGNFHDNPQTLLKAAQYLLDNGYYGEEVKS